MSITTNVHDVLKIEILPQEKGHLAKWRRIVFHTGKQHGVTTEEHGTYEVTAFIHDGVTELPIVIVATGDPARPAAPPVAGPGPKEEKEGSQSC